MSKKERMITTSYNAYKSDHDKLRRIGGGDNGSKGLRKVLSDREKVCRWSHDWEDATLLPGCGAIWYSEEEFDEVGDWMKFCFNCGGKVVTPDDKDSDSVIDP